MANEGIEMLSAGPSQGHTCLPPMAGPPKCEELPLHIRVHGGCQGQTRGLPFRSRCAPQERAGEQDSQERGVQLGPAAGAISKGGFHRFLGVKVDSSSKPHNIAPQARTPRLSEGPLADLLLRPIVLNFMRIVATRYAQSGSHHSERRE